MSDMILDDMLIIFVMILFIILLGALYYLYREYKKKKSERDLGNPIIAVSVVLILIISSIGFLAYILYVNRTDPVHEFNYDLRVIAPEENCSYEIIVPVMSNFDGALPCFSSPYSVKVITTELLIADPSGEMNTGRAISIKAIGNISVNFNSTSLFGQVRYTLGQYDEDDNSYSFIFCNKTLNISIDSRMEMRRRPGGRIWEHHYLALSAEVHPGWNEIPVEYDWDETE